MFCLIWFYLRLLRKVLNARIKSKQDSPLVPWCHWGSHFLSQQLPADKIRPKHREPRPLSLTMRSLPRPDGAI